MIVIFVMVGRARFLSAVTLFQRRSIMQRNEKVEVKLTSEEKAALAAKAETAGTTKSALIRSLIADDNRIVVLGDSQQILTAVYRLNDLLEQCLEIKTFDAAMAVQVRDAMHKIGVGLCEAARVVTELTDDEDGDENVDP